MHCWFSFFSVSFFMVDLPGFQLIYQPLIRRVPQVQLGASFILPLSLSRGKKVSNASVTSKIRKYVCIFCPELFSELWTTIYNYLLSVMCSKFPYIQYVQTKLMIFDSFPQIWPFFNFPMSKNDQDRNQGVIFDTSFSYILIPKPSQSPINYIF